MTEDQRKIHEAIDEAEQAVLRILDELDCARKSGFHIRKGIGGLTYFAPPDWDLAERLEADLRIAQQRVELLREKLKRVDAGPAPTRIPQPTKGATGRGDPPTKETRINLMWKNVEIVAKRLAEQRGDITLIEIAESDEVNQCFPPEKMPSVETIVKHLQGKGLTRKGRRKAR